MNALSSRGFFSVFTAALLGLLIAAQESAATTINILPLGDSITNDAFYVAPLETLLTNAGYGVTVGTNEGKRGYFIAQNYTINGTAYTLPNGWQGILEGISTTGTGYLNQPNVNSPDNYILMMIGTNDVNNSWDLSDYDVQYRMDLLIAKIQSCAPLAHLIVAQIVPNCGSVALNLAVQRFNIDVGAAVASAQATWPNVSLVDMYPSFNPMLYEPYTSTVSPYYYDNDLHPNQAGGNLMAQVWYNGILATDPGLSPGNGGDGDPGGADVSAPEPSSLAMLAGGGMVLAVWLRRRRPRR